MGRKIDRNIELMAKTIYGEARSEYAKPECGADSLAAVGNVIMNRHVESGKPIAQVCLQPRQFSCWNEDDPNRPVVQNVSLDNEIYRVCAIISRRIIDREIDDITNGANHYYNKTAPEMPRWAAGKSPIFEIGKHVFFKL